MLKRTLMVAAVCCAVLSGSSVLAQRSPYPGSFKSSDERLNKIWDAGARATHLNLQCDTPLVSAGGLHREVMAVNVVFGHNRSAPQKLDLVRDATPLPQWMNGVSSYSLWWIIAQRDWYNYQGDLEYLKQQQEYLSGLLELIMSKINRKKEALDGTRFLDRLAAGNERAIHAGLQALTVMALDAGAGLSRALGDNQLAFRCDDAVDRLRKHNPRHGGSGQAAALLVLAGMIDAEKANRKVISAGGADDFSTLYGYYMLHAKAVAGDYQGALDNIRAYWDGVLPRNQCDGRASGPTSWLTRHVLGVSAVGPGCRTIRIDPHLADLQWVEGTFPTPYGVVTIKHIKNPDGTIDTEVDAPAEVTVIRS